MASERFEMRVDESLLQRIDSWRSEQTDMPGRAEAVRRILEDGLSRSSKESVQISDGEKLLLLMLGDVYKHLKVKGESDPDFIAQVIYGGHYWAPRWRMTGVFHDYHDDTRDLHFVVDVLDMWSFIEEAYARLSKKDKEALEKEAEPFGANPRFLGFDGNNEAQLIGIARFLVDDMDRFTTFKKREMNSHMPTVEGYSRMLSVFEPIRKTLDGHGLSLAQLVKVLNARRYPGR